MRQRLDAACEVAIFHGLCATNPAAAIKREMTEAQGKRDRGQFAALPYREAPAFMAQLRDSGADHGAWHVPGDVLHVEASFKQVFDTLNGRG